jgi:ADP-ribose pyrophosphatase YjhB (NUDIX family)
LQKPIDDDGYSIPGGHVNFGEKSEEALIREFKEEVNADIKVDRLILVGENFFPWGKRLCHQISLYYTIALCDNSQIPLSGKFRAIDETGNERVDLNFYWIYLNELHDLKLYPTNIKEDIISIPENIKHFVYVQ